jgi:alpha-galactosidase
MAKIVLIGAGSHSFSKNLITDILTYPEFRDSTVTLMDIAAEPLELAAAFAIKLVKQNKFKTRIESTTDIREALKGANYVIVAIRVGGPDSSRIDREITLKYGINEAVGDTTGPGGVFYGARHIPAILDICHQMEELCPDAWLLNYTNPMAMITWAVNDYTKIKNVGLCHSVKNTAAELARYIGAPYEEFSYWVAGINHMAWFLEMKWRGEDAYPLLSEKFKDPAIYSKPDAHWAGPDVVRAEIFKAFGYFVTESSRHMSEYVPYFRKRPELIEKYKLEDTGKFAPEAREQERKDQDEAMRKLVSSAEKTPIRHSGEYGSIIIHSLETGKPSRINGNVKNNGLITNLQEGCCVEVPCLVDKEGIHPCYVGDLPPQLAALNRTEINVHELAVRGIMEKNKTKIFQAILLDPLSSAVLTIDETRQMVDEMFQADKKYMKGYKQV